MKKTNMIATVSVLIALIGAALLFFNWNPEALFKLNEPMVSMSDIEQNITTDFTGSPAGPDIPRLTGAEDFSEIIYLADYVTAEPVGIVQTGISSLSPWEDHYYTQRVKGRATGRQIRLPEITSSGWDFPGSYQPYYLLELPDHTSYRGTNSAEQRRQSKREKASLCLCQKVSMTSAARNELSSICAEYGADMDGVFYAFNDKWQEEHQFILLLLRFGAAALLWFVLVAGLIWAGCKLFKIEEA